MNLIFALMIAVSSTSQIMSHLVPGSKEYTINTYQAHYKKSPKTIATFLTTTNFKHELFNIAWLHQHHESIDYFCTKELPLLDGLGKEKRDAIFEKACCENEWHSLVDYCVSKKWKSYVDVLDVCCEKNVAGMTSHALQKITSFNPSWFHTYIKILFPKIASKLYSTDSDYVALKIVYDKACNQQAKIFLMAFDLYVCNMMLNYQKDHYAKLI